MPVASVVLALDVGTRDDPEELPGFVHALAFHLLGGNRELRPGQALADIHDFGGVASMGVGAAQVRFESLVPYSQLDRVLDLEAERLRAPTTSRRVWLKVLSYARKDPPRRLPLPRRAWAEAWDDPKLEHEGRQVPKKLAELVEGSLGAKMTGLLGYHRATLVVVGPDSPQALQHRVAERFADLPARARAPSRLADPWTAPKRSSDSGRSGPREVAMPGQRGDTLVWPVALDARSRVYAQVLCGTLNRMPGGRAGSKAAKLRCSYFDEARRPVLVVRGFGEDPLASITTRLERIRGGAVSELWRQMAERIRRIQAQRETTPRELALLVARGALPPPAGDGEGRHSLAVVSGRSELETVAEPSEVVAFLLDVKHAIHLVAPSEGPKGDAPAKATPRPTARNAAGAFTTHGARVCELDEAEC